MSKKFEAFAELSAEIKAVLQQQGFHEATPVQEATIPLFCGHKDVAVDACTGSGKTLAFILPIMEKLRRLEEPLKKHEVGALVVSPTRELSKQIAGVAEPFVNTLPGVNMLLLVGGRSPAEDVKAFMEAGAQIIIGTPGRIDDVMKRCSAMDWRKLEVLVLDEADRLLDMGFKQQLDAIMNRLPKQRRTGLFSATQTDAVEALARAGLRNPVRVNVTVTIEQKPSKKSKSKEAGTTGQQEQTQKTPQGLRLRYVVCESHEKLPQLVQLLHAHREEKVMVYLLTCLLVEFYSLVLQRLRPSFSKNGQNLPPVWALHGKMKQAQRESILGKFTEAASGCLLCTDLAARGLDIPDVNWIVQLDPPQNPDQFVHRVGRTARMGRSGDALLYLLPHETTYVEFLQLRKVPLQEEPMISGAPDLSQLIRKEAESDREVMEKGTKALVSYVRAYKEHQCKYIFRIQDLDLGYLATALGVLRIPRLPDVRKPKGLEHFTPSAIDPTSVKFKDKAREKQRQKVQQQKEAQAAETKAAKEKPVPMKQDQLTTKLTAAKRRQLQEREELMELEHDYSLLKKLKKGKISHHQFDVATGVSSADESEPEVGDVESSDDDSSEDDRRVVAKLSKDSLAKQPPPVHSGEEVTETNKSEDEDDGDPRDHVEAPENLTATVSGTRVPSGAKPANGLMKASNGVKKKKKKKKKETKLGGAAALVSIATSAQLGEGVLVQRALQDKAKRKDRRLKKAAKRKAQKTGDVAHSTE